MRSLRLLVPFLLGLFLFACAQLGLQSAQTPEDGLRYGQAVMTGGFTTVGASAADRTLPAADARKYFDRLDQAKRDLEPIDTATRAAGGTVPADMMGKLTLTLQVLNAIAVELRARLPATATSSLPAPKPAALAR